MRPVDRGDAKVGKNLGYVEWATHKFDGKIASLMDKVFGTESPDMEQCLKLWLNEVKDLGPQSTKYTQNEMNKVVKKIKTRVNNTYKKATSHLTQRLGNYCSYCESPISGLLEVEHILPKSQYPLYSTKWENFLLACSACNIKKSNNPNREIVEDDWGVMQTSQLNENAYKQKIRNEHYVWPDIDLKSFRYFTYELNYIEDNGLHIIDQEDATNKENKIVSFNIAKREVIAEIIENKKPKKYNVVVLVQPTAGDMEDRAAEMIDLCGLNDDGKGESTHDRRVMNRTLAWFKILEFIKILEWVDSGKNKAENQQKFEILWPIIMTSASSIGFFSMWVDILDEYVAPDQTKLSIKFVQSIRGETYFPNTRTKFIP